MSQVDSLQRFLFDETDIRGNLVQLESSYQEILRRKHYPMKVQQLLGQLMSAVALLSATLKIKGTLSIQAKGVGAVSLLMAECTNDKDLRGIARFPEGTKLEDSALPEGGIIGQGHLAITIEPTGGQRYQGIVPLHADDIVASLEEYFDQSEQLGTRVWLSSNDERTAGMLLQKLPEQVGKDADAWERVTHLASTVRDDELLGLPPQQILHRLFHEEQVRLYEPTPMQFRCTCSKQRMGDAIVQLGYPELQSILDEQGKIQVDCQFCGQHYSFDQTAVNEFFPVESAEAGQNKLH